MDSLDDVVERMLEGPTIKIPDKPTPTEKTNHQKHESNVDTFTCIGIRKGCIATGRGKAPVAIMELESDGMTDSA